MDAESQQVEELKAKVEAGRVELREQWERMQKENLELKVSIERLLLKHEKERHVFLNSLLMAAEEIERLKANK
jgi:hypothetical protein